MALTADQIFALNRMNSIAFKYGLGTLLDEALGGAAGISLGDGKIFLGNSGGVAAQVTPTGDVTISDTGAMAIGAGKVTPAMLQTPSGSQELTGALTQAQILALSVTPITLVPAPGAGKVLVVDFVEMFHSYSTAAYANGGDLQLLYTGSTAILQADVSLVTQAASASWWSTPTITDLDSSTGTAKGGLQVDGLANLGVQLKNLVAPFITGNVANVLKWRVRYRTVTLLT